MKVYEKLSEMLLAGGITHGFGLLGEDIVKLFVDLESNGLHYTSARHENQAIAMADGFNRTTGRSVLACVTGGPGFTNGLTAMNTVNRAGSGVITIAGEGDTAAKKLENQPVLDSLGIYALCPRTSAEATRDVAEAINRANQCRPTVLTLSQTILDMAVEDEPQHETDESIKHASMATTQTSAHRAPSTASITNLCDFIETEWVAKHPVILAGRGAVLADARDSLEALASRIGAVVATTLRAPAFFYQHDFSIGIAGTYSHTLATEVLGKADFVLSFGASLNKFTTYGGDLFPNAVVAQIDVDRSALGLNVDVSDELKICGDAKISADAIVDELERRNYRNEGFRTANLSRRIREYRAGDDFQPIVEDGFIDPRVVATRLDEVLSKDRIVVVDGAHNSGFWIPYVGVTSPQKFVQTSYAGGASSIGLSTGAAIGSALGNPGQTVASFVGDAGILMGLGDLETAARLSLSIVFIVGNDQALGAEVHFLSIHGMPTDLVQIPSPKFENLAHGLGIEGYTVTSPSTLDSVIDRLKEPVTGPILIDCRIVPSLKAEFVDLLFRSH